MSLILAHEVTHTLGMEDTYLDFPSEHSGEEMLCIMEAYITNTADALFQSIEEGSSNALCEYCSSLFNQRLHLYTDAYQHSKYCTEEHGGEDYE